jgi:hypothetical protein
MKKKRKKGDADAFQWTHNKKANLCTSPLRFVINALNSNA